MLEGSLCQNYRVMLQVLKTSFDGLSWSNYCEMCGRQSVLKCTDSTKPGSIAIMVALILQIPVEKYKAANVDYCLLGRYTP